MVYLVTHRLLFIAAWRWQKLKGEHARMSSSKGDYLATGVKGLDELLSGGLPRGSLIMVGGRPGAGKTLLASHFLYEGASRGERGIYVSFAETKEQFLEDAKKLDLDFQEFLSEEKFRFLDLTTVSSEGVTDALDLILSQVVSFGARRLVIDSFSALAVSFAHLSDARIALHTILGKAVRSEGCTTMILTEIPYGKETMGLGMEEFVADGIILMDIIKQRGGPRRTINIRKMRGTEISLRPSSYAITKAGLVVFPALQQMERRGLTERRTPTGIPGLDRLIEGGLLEGSITGLVGSAGVGKTTFGLQFLYDGAKSSRDKGLFVSFSEPVSQLKIVAKGLGLDRVHSLEKSGRLKMAYLVPEQHTPEELVLKLQELLDKVQPRRVVLDDVGALQAIAEQEEFDALIGVTARLCQERGATLVLSIATSELVGARSITEMSLSTVMDNILMLRYVEVDGKMDRSLTILKMRATHHDNSIRSFQVGTGGLNLGGSFAGYTGVLSGTATRDITLFEKKEEKIARGETKAREKRKRAFHARIKSRRTRPLRPTNQ